MPPTIPTTSCSSRYSPYSRQPESGNTPVQRPSPPSTPAQKIMTATSSPPPSSPVEEATIPDSRPSSPICAEEETRPFIKTPKPYVINFGRHVGKILSQVPDSYVLWLHTKIKDGWFGQERYDGLRAALAVDKNWKLRKHWNHSWQNSDPCASISCPGKPPALESAPSIFYEDVTCAPLWISEDDITPHFKLDRQYLKYLPRVSGGRHEVIGNASAWHYLFHVFDFVKTHTSKLVADQGLEEFLRKNEDRAQEIRGMLGLEAF